MKDFQETVRKQIDEITSRGKLPIIVGGTGLYIKAALYDYELVKQKMIMKHIKKNIKIMIISNYMII